MKAFIYIWQYDVNHKQPIVANNFFYVTHKLTWALNILFLSLLKQHPVPFKSYPRPVFFYSHMLTAAPIPLTGTSRAAGNFQTEAPQIHLTHFTLQGTAMGSKQYCFYYETNSSSTESDHFIQNTRLTYSLRRLLTWALYSKALRLLKTFLGAWRESTDGRRRFQDKLLTYRRIFSLYFSPQVLTAPEYAPLSLFVTAAETNPLYLAFLWTKRDSVFAVESGTCLRCSVVPAGQNKRPV